MAKTQGGKMNEPRVLKFVFYVALGTALIILTIMWAQNPYKVARTVYVPTSTRTPGPTSTPQPTFTPKPVEFVTFKEISAAKESMTDARWQIYRASLIGKRVRWHGAVYDVQTANSGETWLYITMINRLFFDFYDVAYVIPSSDALLYSKGMCVKWEGDIEQINDDFDTVEVFFQDVKQYSSCYVQ